MKGVVESLKIVTEWNTERLCRFAFDQARKHGRQKVTLVHKAVSSKVKTLHHSLIKRRKRKQQQQQQQRFVKEWSMQKLTGIFYALSMLLLFMPKCSISPSKRLTQTDCSPTGNAHFYLQMDGKG